MTAKFDLNDDGVVVVIGTGAGGGVLSNELAHFISVINWFMRRSVHDLPSIPPQSCPLSLAFLLKFFLSCFLISFSNS